MLYTSDAVCKTSPLPGAPAPRTAPSCPADRDCFTKTKVALQKAALQNRLLYKKLIALQKAAFKAHLLYKSDAGCKASPFPAALAPHTAPPCPADRARIALQKAAQLPHKNTRSCSVASRKVQQAAHLLHKSAKNLLSCFTNSVDILN